MSLQTPASKRSIKLVLPMPPSLNKAYRCVPFIRAGRAVSRVLLSKEARIYKDAACAAIRGQAPENLQLKGFLRTVVAYSPKWTQDYDEDNYKKVLYDSLVMSGVIADDSKIPISTTIKARPGSDRCVVWIAETEKPDLVI